MRLSFQLPTTTRMTNDVVVKEIVLFTVLQFSPRIPKQKRVILTRICILQKSKVSDNAAGLCQIKSCVSL